MREREKKYRQILKSFKDIFVFADRSSDENHSRKEFFFATDKQKEKRR